HFQTQASRNKRTPIRDSNRGIQQAKSPADTPEGAATSPALDDEDVEILRILKKRAPMLLTVGQISVPTGICETTVAQRVKQLIAVGLATRPKGPKRGATITPEGQALLSKIVPDKTTR